MESPFEGDLTAASVFLQRNLEDRIRYSELKMNDTTSHTPSSQLKTTILHDDGIVGTCPCFAMPSISIDSDHSSI